MNLPNKLSLFRIVLVPLLVVVYLFPFKESILLSYNGHTLTLVNLICFLIFMVASITDFLDGYIARKNNLITSFGKFIDPIADKLLVNTSFILLAFNEEVSLIAVIIMIWRDTIVDAIRMMASAKGKVMAAKMLGKIKTVVQMFAIIFAFLQDFPLVYMGIAVSDLLVWIACFVSVLSGISYFNQAKDVLMESM